MMIRYLSGLLVCGLGLFGGGWLIVVVVLLGGTPTIASLASLGTGAGIALVSAVGIACWSAAWRQRMRLDGVLALPSRPAAEGTPGATVRRNRRALRRDMRHAARVARRVPARNEAPGPDEAAWRGGAPWLAEAACPDDGARPDEAVRRKAAASAGRPGRRDRHPAIPVPRIPSAAETAHGGSGGAGERPAVVLTELRALLEPLLTTDPSPVLDGEPDDPTAGDLLGEEESW
jgi:hypothetical protein